MAIRMAMMAAVIVCTSAVAGPVGQTGADAARPCPFAGHNCYSDLNLRLSRHKLATALRAGLRTIEVDVHHNPTAGGFVVTHTSKDPPAEPLLGEFLTPMWRQWRDEPGEHILIIDLKGGRPDAVARDMHEYLRAYRDVLCTFAPDGSARSTGPIRVCLTGSRALGQAYIDLAGRKGELLALRDGSPGGRGGDALRRYLRRPARPGVGFLTLPWGVVDGGSAAGDYVDWLSEIVAGARRNGYQLRVYTLNVPLPKRLDGRLVSGEWDAHWSACVRAGVDMISTDTYALAAEWWKQIGSKLEPIQPGAKSKGPASP